MEREEFLSGYCRCMDNSRMVAVLLEDSKLTEVDCLFGSCPHEQECQIAKKIRDLVQNAHP